jgi:hypothetical protein
MDGVTFDRMTKSLAGRTRRSLLKAGLGAVLGGAAGGLGLGRASAALKRAPGDICRKGGDCTSGLCLAKDATGRQRCGCVTTSDCPQPDAGDPCRSSTCSQAGVCGLQINEGASCNNGAGACDATGACVDLVCVGTTPGTASCTGDGDCAAGETCVNGGCFQNCADLNGCSDACTDCRCSSSSESSTLYYCTDLNFSVGTCDDDTADCPAGSFCNPLVTNGDSTLNLCVRPCPKLELQPPPIG